MIAREVLLTAAREDTISGPLLCQLAGAAVLAGCEARDVAPLLEGGEAAARVAVELAGRVLLMSGDVAEAAE